SGMCWAKNSATLWLGDALVGGDVQDREIWHKGRPIYKPLGHLFFAVHPVSASPMPGQAVEVEGRVRADDGKSVPHGMDDDHPVKRVAISRTQKRKLLQQQLHSMYSFMSSSGASKSGAM